MHRAPHTTALRRRTPPPVLVACHLAAHVVQGHVVLHARGAAALHAVAQRGAALAAWLRQRRLRGGQQAVRLQRAEDHHAQDAGRIVVVLHTVQRAVQGRYGGSSAAGHGGKVAGGGGSTRAEQSGITVKQPSTPMPPASCSLPPAPAPPGERRQQPAAAAGTLCEFFTKLHPLTSHT